MRTHTLGSFRVSAVGLGTAEFGGRCPESLAREFMDAYMALGGNLIDTARVYGDFVTPKNGESEKVIGRWLSDRHCREKIFLSTKGGHPPLRDMTRSRLDRASVRADIDASLEALGTGRTDMYWLHRDDPERPVGDILETLQGLIEDGLTSLTGVSNWHPRRIREALLYAGSHGLRPPAANQPQFSLAKPVSVSDSTLCVMDSETYRMHLETGLPCFCFSSQAHGFFTRLEAVGEKALPESLQKGYLCAENLAVYQRLRTVGRETGLSVGAAAVGYLTSQPFPTFALAGASRLEQVLALEEAGNAVLTPAQRDFLRIP